MLIGVGDLICVFAVYMLTKYICKKSVKYTCPFLLSLSESVIGFLRNCLENFAYSKLWN